MLQKSRPRSPEQPWASFPVNVFGGIFLSLIFTFIQFISIVILIFWHPPWFSMARASPQSGEVGRRLAGLHDVQPLHGAGGAVHPAERRDSLAASRMPPPHRLIGLAGHLLKGIQKHGFDDAQSFKVLNICVKGKVQTIRVPFFFPWLFQAFSSQAKLLARIA